MNWKNTLGYGVVIWVVMFVVVSALVAFGIYGNYAVKALLIVLAGVLGYWFALRAGMADWTKAAMLGVSWVIVGIVLDYLISSRFDPSILSSRVLWAGYALTFIGALAGSMWGNKPAASSTMPV